MCIIIFFKYSAPIPSHIQSGTTQTHFCHFRHLEQSRKCLWKISAWRLFEDKSCQKNWNGNKSQHSVGLELKTSATPASHRYPCCSMDCCRCSWNSENFGSCHTGQRRMIDLNWRRFLRNTSNFFGGCKADPSLIDSRFAPDHHLAKNLESFW